MAIAVNNSDGVCLLSMRDGDNRMNRSWVSEMNEALDRIESDDTVMGLVTTGEGKFFSNGLDLDWLLSPGTEPMAEFVVDVERLFARLLGFPVVTVAACNGHAFAAGAMFALCHDFRIMRGDRGFFCLPEVDIKIPFTPGMNALVRGRMSPQIAHEAMVTGKRYGGFEAAEQMIVDEAVEEAEVVSRALDLAGTAGRKDRVILETIKRRMYGSVIDLLVNSSGTQPM